MDSVASYVRRYSLDSLLSADLLQALRPLRRAPGELVIQAGDPVRDLLFFMEGRIKIGELSRSEYASQAGISLIAMTSLLACRFPDFL